MEKIILKAVIGSKAYNLDTPESDTDVMGIFVVSTEKILGVYNITDTVVHHNPDETYHEVGKFVHLALKGNPTILELLFTDKYLTLTEEGKLLVANRKAFLSNVIYHSYAGYALSQAQRLAKRGYDFKRYSKHARHCFRVLLQGRELLEKGTLHVRLSDTQREELFKVGELPPDKILERFDKEFQKFKDIKSVLPDKPDYETINKVLLQIRMMNMNLTIEKIIEGER